MEYLEISGGRKLDGKIEVQSAKNSVLPIMAGAILVKGVSVIRKCPKISDVFSMCEILNYVGVETRFNGDDLIIDSTVVSGNTVPCLLSQKLRSSTYMIGGLLPITKKIITFFSGGCKIGKRPINYHVYALKKLGGKVIEKEDSFIFSVDSLDGANIVMPYPSVGATVNAILLSVLAKGSTVISNSAKEPEIADLCNFLISCGAKIFGVGKSTITIEGVKKLHGTVYKPIGDRIEAGTFLLSTAITGGKIELSNVNFLNFAPLLNKISNNTCFLNIKNDIIKYEKKGDIMPFDFSTGPYPDFPTDLQPQTVALLSTLNGTSFVYENVFENRFLYTKELIKMGARIANTDTGIKISGVKKLNPADLFALDLRGGASLVVASLYAEGVSKVFGLEYIDRGYENIEVKLKSLGADIKRVKS